MQMIISRKRLVADHLESKLGVIVAHGRVHGDLICNSRGWDQRNSNFWYNWACNAGIHVTQSEPRNLARRLTQDHARIWTSTGNSVA